ncbi:SRPBCC family protein [Gordonia liuliyuniae]|uniref:SRPBCC family protein n=1 Tax=Gordonia liuliyuniae TaxID=2911517 RepID=A0ABS9IVD8_9ACTN|nr:SRPBCC family protein [Gordonia liuliyuniae]MCF8589532.1 SRPBCC family protein [Gordonia liuliyuniae]MCF8589942.1 SRPBCC family protein [Gordonia liuliyuniae]
MPGVHHTVRTQVPRSAVFAYVDDPNTVPQWMFGVTAFDPVGDRSRGLGAEYDAVMKVGPKSLSARLEVAVWTENEELVLSSVAGFDVTTRWRFTDGDDGYTVVDVDFDYNLPGGLAGRALGALIEPVVGQAVRQTEQALRDALEQPIRT